jgi:hypothetical protein
MVKIWWHKIRGFESFRYINNGLISPKYSYAVCQSMMLLNKGGEIVFDPDPPDFEYSIL